MKRKAKAVDHRPEEWGVGSDNAMMPSFAAGGSKTARKALKAAKKPAKKR